MSKLTFLLAAGLAALAVPAAYSDILVSESSFATATKQEIFTAGTDALGTFFFRDGAVEGTGGANGSSYLRLASFGPSAVFAIASPESLSSISFDRAFNGDFSGFRLNVFGLTNGQTISTQNQTATAGVRLFESPVQQPTGGAFQNSTLDLSQISINPQTGVQDFSAFDVIAFKFEANFNPSNPPGAQGIDNVILDGIAVIPEPTTAMLLMTGLTISAGMIRRRK
jgi:hypothetical protein